MQAFVDFARQQFGRVDVMVNNAGVPAATAIGTIMFHRVCASFAAPSRIGCRRKT